MEIRTARRIGPLALLLAGVSIPLLACGSRAGDAPLDAGAPTPLGGGSRIRDVADPTLPTHAASANVTITGATFLWIDTFDETNNGKSRGTVFIQDTGENVPYSGISLFSPTYQPASLKPAPGDVLDLAGAYQENSAIGSAKFPAPQVLPQIAKPIVQPRFEYVVPPAAVIDPNDLNDYDKGRQWLSMLVTIQNPTFTDDLTDDGNGRDTVHLTSTTTNGVTMSNELFDVATWNKTSAAIGKGKTVKSITGIVTWFFSYHVAPRTPDDIVVQ